MRNSKPPNGDEIKMLMARGSANTELTSEELKDCLFTALHKLGPKRKVMVIPPDITRIHSRAGELTRFVHEYYGDRLEMVIPALGTHAPMTASEIDHMFGDIPTKLFRDHNWRSDTVTLGEVPREYIHSESQGALNFSWPVQVNFAIINGGFDLILSLGQVVPHEVMGMSSHSKNILIGLGGELGINRSHFLAAVYGVEQVMGRSDNPVRRLLNRATELFLSDLPIVHVLTVVGASQSGQSAVKGLFIGSDLSCFSRACELSLEVNLKLEDRPLKKVVVYLDSIKFKSTWIGNKAIYRTRMALDDGAELIILAPGLKSFGEDPRADSLIRKYGFSGRQAILRSVKENSDLASELSTAANLIQSSSEGRFQITYCPGVLTRDEIEGVGFQYGNLEEMAAKYDPRKLIDGPNIVGNEEIYYISNPALGLWSHRSRFAHPK